MKDQKTKYAIQKNNKYKSAKITFKKGLIVITLGTIGLITLFTNLKKNKMNKEIKNTSFEQTLEMNQDNTCLDELLEKTNLVEEIDILERQLVASEQLNDINLEKYEIKTQDLDYSNITINDIEKDIELFYQNLNEINKGNINLNLPTEETQNFYELLNRIKNVDSPACNNYIIRSYERIEELYTKMLKAKFLDVCNSNSIEENDIEIIDKVERPFLNLEKAEDYIYNQYYLECHSNNKDYSYKLKKGSNKLVSYNLDDIKENADKAQTKLNYNQYNKERNKIIKEGLYKIKKLFYYDLDVNKNSITGKMSYENYKKVRKK